MSRQLIASLPVGKIRLDLVANPITTAAYTTVVDPFPAPCAAISVAYTGIGILKLAKGAVGLEVDLPLFITPGMNHEILIPLNLAKGLRLSAECEDQNVSSGELVINLYG